MSDEEPWIPTRVSPTVGGRARLVDPDGTVHETTCEVRPTLSDFLLARIAEDEAVARAVPDDTDPKSAAPVFSSLSEPTGTVEMQPARVLAVCAAHRRIVEAHAPDAAPCFWTQGGVNDDHEDDPCPTLRALASAYADRDGWREEWR